MLSENLKQRLADAGFPLLEGGKAEESESLLFEVVKSGDLRLLHGFPVLLANALEKGGFSAGGFLRLLKTKKELTLVSSLTALSADTYKEAGYKSGAPEELAGQLKEKKADYKTAGLNLKKAVELFKLYFKPESGRAAETLEARKNMSLEYSLSKLFSPKQKELVLRKYKGEKMSKTEKEYYSRTVRKKLSAVANRELHDLAAELTGK